MISEKKVMVDQNAFIIGIDFGSISVVHKNDASSIFTVAFCKEPKCKLNTSKSNEEKVDSISELSNDTNIHLCEINQYLSNISQDNGELSVNLKTEIINYLKQSHMLMIKTLYINETFIKSKFFKDFKQENFLYYISCEQPKLIRDCFIGAGLIKDHELRLTFVRKVKSSYTVALAGLKDVELKSSMVRKENFPIDFVVGIDFGTTFSGSSYARLSIPSVMKIVKSDGLIEKFPTVVMYKEDEKDIELKYWGQEAINNYQAIYDNLLFLDKFKLFMLPDRKKQEIYSYGNTSIGDNRIDIVQVISDYLKSFKEYIEEYINDNEVDIRRTSLDKAIRVLRLEKKFNFKYILNVPEDEKSQKIVLEAAEIAKLVTSEQDSFMITELRSVALYYADLRNFSLSQNGDTFLICDAGGATVNVGTYRLENLKDGTKNLVQIGSNLSDACGSIYLDENFINYIYQFYKDIGVHIDKTLLRFDSIEAHFVQHIKPNFMPEKKNDCHYKVNLPSISDYIKPEHTKKYRLTSNNRVLLIKNEVIDKQVFEPVFKRIESMLDKHMENINVKTIVLVGGLSQSKYLQQRLKDRYKSRAQLDVPVDYDSAVSRGAVLYGLEPKKVHFSCV